MNSLPRLLLTRREQLWAHGKSTPPPPLLPPSSLPPPSLLPSSSLPPPSLLPPSSLPPPSLLPIALFKFLLYIRLVICGYITDEVPAINPSVAEWADSINATVELLNVAKLSSKDGMSFFFPFCFRFSIYSLISFNR